MVVLDGGLALERQHGHAASPGSDLFLRQSDTRVPGCRSCAGPAAEVTFVVMAQPIHPLQIAMLPSARAHRFVSPRATPSSTPPPNSFRQTPSIKTPSTETPSLLTAGRPSL